MQQLHPSHVQLDQPQHDLQQQLHHQQQNHHHQQLHQEHIDEASECLDMEAMQSLYNDTLPQIPIYSHCEVVTESSSQVLTTDPPATVLLGPVTTGYPDFHSPFIQSEQDPTMPVVKVGDFYKFNKFVIYNGF